MTPSPRLSLLAVGLALTCAACSTSCSQHRAGEAASAAAPGPSAPSPTPPTAGNGNAGEAELLSAEIATVGWDGLTDSPIVLLREQRSGKVVPIWVGIAEARAIAAALHGVEFPRPMTHDLMRNLVDELGAVLEEVHIDEIRDGTYLGTLKLRIKGRETPLLVDTRPSDGMALALRTGALIRVAQGVLDQTPDFDFLAPEAGQQVVRSLGLTVVAPTPELREEYTLPDRPGVVVTSAMGEAASQGMQRGDLIVDVNGTVPGTPIEFLDTLRAASPTAPVTLTYWRADEEHTVELLPQPLPDDEDDKPKQIA